MFPRRLLLSIRPVFAERIFACSKRVELRRIRPRLASGDHVIIYIPAPICAIAGIFVVRNVLAASPYLLWRHVKGDAGISRTDYNAYFTDASVAYAIAIGATLRFDEPLTLQKLRRHAPGFCPPQSYHFLWEHRADDRAILRLIKQSMQPIDVNNDYAQRKAS